MAFRDDVVAARTRTETLQAELDAGHARERRLEAEIRGLKGELDRLLRGASNERLLAGDPHFGVGQILLPVAGLLGAALSLVVWAAAVRTSFSGHVELSARGVSNFMAQLATVDGVGALFLLLLAVTLAVLPVIAALGVHRRRRWGWNMAILNFALWVIPCPPLGIYGLYAFARERIRGAFLGWGWEAVAASISDELDSPPA